MTATRAFAAAVVRSLVRHPTVLLFGLVVPVLFTVALAPGTGVTIGVTGDQGDPMGRAVVRSLQDADGVRVRGYADEASLRRAVRHGSVAAGVALPADLELAVDAGGAARVRYTISPAEPDGWTARLLVTSALADADARLSAARFTARARGRHAAGRLALASRAQAAQGAAVRVAPVAGTEPAGRFAASAPRNLVLFVFLTSLSAGALLVQLRVDGTLRRIAATPATPAAVIGGLAAGWALVAVTQSAILIAAGGLLGVSWGAFAPAAALVLASAAVGCGAGLLVGAVARDERRVAAVAPVVALTLGALGGCLVPLEAFSPTMLALSRAVPQRWALDAWTTLTVEGGGLRDILLPLAILAAMAVALLAAAAERLRRELEGR
jgi:ABC-2 type transport system permease protein